MTGSATSPRALHVPGTMQVREDYSMKKITLIAAGIIAAGIVSTATTQATALQLPETSVAIRADEPVSTCDQPLLRETSIAVSSPELESTILIYGSQELRGTMLVEDDTSEDEANPYIKRQTHDSPYIKRQGHGRSRRKSRAADEDNSDAEDEETEAFEDDSSVKFNRDLKNTTGYNEDL